MSHPSRRRLGLAATQGACAPPPRRALPGLGGAMEPPAHLGPPAGFITLYTTTTTPPKKSLSGLARTRGHPAPPGAESRAG